ncbi:lipoprotein [Brevibacillus reuszeri]|uniref:Lipoprotein n=1 Tax=Brevibacillus reuszeri TaxID=54915 RepID=A0A0K9YSY9_9BACL|nr:efflux RND transporter periplasmic adaptor subunit [Brevibacillus reuszeri]KNB71767.1 RND transporter [Brevibacillus reuszeri]MED1855407.1 efflux RND transporter periplasmic adaptor subunit [Brevibacillus reuszeri]GED67444.1 lipoprotein [Brevibacillus reuszeri]
MKRKWLVSVMMLGIVTTTACSGQQPAAAPVKEVKHVVMDAVKKEQATTVSELSGTLAPLEEAMVSFEVGGRIVELNRNEGDTVKAGDVLAKVNAQDYSLQVASSSAAVQQSAANLSKVNNGAREQEITQARLLVEKATIGYQKMQDDFKRIEQLYKEKAISKSDFDSAQNGLTLSQKDLENAQQAYSLVTQGARAEDKDLSRATYNQAVIAQEVAASSLAKTQLRSPINGTIISKLSSTGSLVGSGTPVYQVGNIDTLKVVLPVPDREISMWKEGEVVSLDLYGQKREGKVTKIFPATNQSTGTIGVEVQIANAKHDWYAGQVVKATKTIQGQVGIYAPVEAVISRGNNDAHVFINQDGKAVKTSVEIGQITNDKLEIKSGLKEGDQLIVKGVDRLFDGDPIETAGGTQP